ncbi:integrase [Betaproteobacteria bacterium]|nr:integrase [Betaproteobacteria bacterium]
MTMFKYSKDGVSVLTVQDTRKKKLSGLFPIKIQVVYNRVQRYYSTGKELSVEDWKILPNTKSTKLVTIRADIKNSFDKVQSAVHKFVEDGDFSFEALNAFLGKCVTDTINIAFENKMQALMENNQVGSYLYYKCTLTSIERFAGKHIQITSITVDWLKRYEKHLLSIGNSYTTVGMNCRAVRCIINEARKVGIIKENQYPFGHGKYEIPTGQGRNMALNIQQIKSIITYSDGREATEKYRDMWFFSYLCNGINFADMLRLKYANIQNGEVCFLRAKTSRTSKVKKEVCAMLTPEMQSIIDKWGNPSRKPDDYIFDYLTGKETPLEVKTTIQSVIRLCNRRLKKIGTALGIEGVSTYTARHMNFSFRLKTSKLQE